MLYLRVTCSIIQIYDIPSKCASHTRQQHYWIYTYMLVAMNLFDTSDKSVPLISVLFVWTEPSWWTIVLCVILHSMPVLWNERLKFMYQLCVLHRHHCSSAATSTIKQKIHSIWAPVSARLLILVCNLQISELTPWLLFHRRHLTHLGCKFLLYLL